MKNFDELFNEAAKVADHRKKVLNQLIEKTIKEILPKFCEALENYDISRTFFKLETKPNSYCEKKIGYEYNCFYIIAIDVKNKKYCDAKLDEYSGDYEVPEGWTFYPFSNDSEKFLRTGIVEFVKALNNRLEYLNKKYSEKTKEAELL